MALEQVPSPLVLAIVALIALRAGIGALFLMTAHVVIPVTDSCESQRAVTALEWTKASVDSGVNQKVAPLAEADLANAALVRLG